MKLLCFSQHRAGKKSQSPNKIKVTTLPNKPVNHLGDATAFSLIYAVRQQLPSIPVYTVRLLHSSHMQD